MQARTGNTRDAGKSGAELPSSAVEASHASVGFERALGNRGIAELLGDAPAGAPRIQRKGMVESSAAEVLEPAASVAPAATTALIVEDTERPGPGQLTRLRFLAQLRQAVCETADEALASAGRDSSQCPWIAYWFDYYAGQSATHIESAVRKYAPETAQTRTAEGYVAAATARVGRAVRHWVATGEITGIPAGVPTTFAGTAQEGAAGIFLKGPAGGAGSADPEHVQRELGGGGALPSELRTRMESVFGGSFGGVRLHTDAKAASLSENLEARAFTVGNHVAFGAGEYQPGTIAGEALLAHELAHVVQQRGATGAAPLQKGATSDGALEADADRAATSAVLSLWGGAKGSLGSSVLPSIRSGLRISRCDGKSSKSSPAPTPAPAPAPPGPTPAELGKQARTTAKDLLDKDEQSKAATDKLSSALGEIRKGEALGYHKTKTLEILKQAAKTLGVDETAVVTDWTWFLDNGPPSAKTRADDKTWQARRAAFMARFQSKINKFEAGRSKSQGKYALKNTPENVFTLIHEVATPSIPPAFLYTIAATEGLIDNYVRPQVASPGARDKLSEAELATVSVTKPVSGFGALGLDDFFTELDYSREPLKNFFPAGFDETKVTEVPAENEKGRIVRSASAPNLKTALQALVALVARRQALFQADAKALGYPAPSSDELVYFTYIYYNSGPGAPSLGDGTSKDNGGFQTLSRHRPGHKDTAERRQLNDWIKKGEYPNAIKVLQTYQVIVDSGVLKGY